MPSGDDSDTELMIIPIGVIQPENIPHKTRHTLVKISALHMVSDQHCPSTHFISIYFPLIMHLYPRFKGLKQLCSQPDYLTFSAPAAVVQLHI